MAITVKETMLLGKYSDQAVGGDDPKLTADDAKLFNRKELYEVILMIQKVVDHFDYKEVAEVRRVETLIQNELPGDIREQTKVKDWLIKELS